MISGLEDWTRAVAKLPLVAQPGTEWNYSVGMDVLGRPVEVVSGQSYGDFLRTRIFEPLGMQDTGFVVPDAKLERFAANYAPQEGGGMQLIDSPRTSRYRKPPLVEFGGAGLAGTAADYFRFAQMLANGGSYEDTRILGSRTVEFMMSNHLTPDFPDDPMTSLFGFLSASGLTTEPRIGYRHRGVGFGITGSVVTNPATAALPASAGTFSWGGAASTHFWVDREEELVGIVHTQLLPDGTYPVRELMQSLTYQAITD